MATGRTNTTPTVATSVNARNCHGRGSPIAARTAVTSAAPPSSPSAAVRVKISATPKRTAVINQISQGSIACASRWRKENATYNSFPAFYPV